jgi:hypothetical protein
MGPIEQRFRFGDKGWILVIRAVWGSAIDRSSRHWGRRRTLGAAGDGGGQTDDEGGGEQAKHTPTTIFALTGSM